MRNRYIWLFLTLIFFGVRQTSAAMSHPALSITSTPHLLTDLQNKAYISTFTISSSTLLNQGYAAGMDMELRSQPDTEVRLRPFGIQPPWYTSAWAYASYTLLAILMLYGTWLVIVHREQRRHRRQSRYGELTALRTANRELSRELELRNAEIFSQSSLLLTKNEMIGRICDLVEDFTHRQGNKSLMPLFHKINTIVANNLDTDGDWKLFLIRFEQTHAGFFRTLKDRYPDLTCSDLRLCACLKLRLDSKQIAALMNLSLRAVENSRYRLRKKLELEPAQNLNDFLMNITPALSSTEEGVQENIEITNIYRSAS